MLWLNEWDVKGACEEAGGAPGVVWERGTRPQTWVQDTQKLGALEQSSHCSERAFL